MTVKRRLFVSNILMLLIPVVLTLLTASILLSIYFNSAGVKAFNNFVEIETFNRRVSDVIALSQKWTDETEISEIKEDVDDFNSKRNNSRKLYVYEGSEPTFENLAIPDSFPVDTILSQGINIVIINENFASYLAKSGEYTLILIDSEYTITAIKGNKQDNYGVSIFMFSVLIIAVLVTSRLLSASVFRSITKPLDILIDGVHQIRDGNLTHRIEYNGKDEFSGVCSDFNEMAERLSESVDRRQRDENNRKELIAGISHDLRTPLTSIKAYLEGIEKGVASTPQIRTKYFDTIKAKTTELEQIINQLFLFSKIDIGEFPFRMEKTDIVADIKDFTETIIEEYKENGLNIETEQFEEKIFVELDKMQFHNVLTNIIGNSLKYKVKEQGTLRINFKTADGKVTVELTDDGAGVPQESIDKLFDVFYRCDPSRSNQNSGSGLGLAISAKVIDRLKGTITARNADSGGLTISITLPIAEDKTV